MARERERYSTLFFHGANFFQCCIDSVPSTFCVAVAAPGTQGPKLLPLLRKLEVGHIHHHHLYNIHCPVNAAYRLQRDDCNCHCIAINQLCEAITNRD